SGDTSQARRGIVSHAFRTDGAPRCGCPCRRAAEGLSQLSVTAVKNELFRTLGGANVGGSLHLESPIDAGARGVLPPTAGPGRNSDHQNRWLHAAGIIG